MTHDKRLSPCIVAEMGDAEEWQDDPNWLAGFQARLREVMQLRGMSQRQLSLAAGRSQSHVGAILRGEVRERISARVVASFARAGQVEYAWLATGIGPREASQTRQVELEHRYPNLKKALKRLRSELLPETLEWAWSNAGHEAIDRSEGTWIDVLQEKDAELRAAAKGKAVAARPLADEDDTPPAGRE